MKLLTVAAAGSLLLTSLFSVRSYAQQKPTDANIGAIVLAANQIDIDHAKIAAEKASNSEVRQFAQQMITDHEAVQKSVVELAGKLKLTPVDDETSKGLKSKAAEVTAKLKSLKGKEFDVYYIDNEIAYHKLVIDAMKGVLIPNAQNAELKSALQKTEPLFVGHLEHAQKIQSMIDSKAPHS